MNTCFGFNIITTFFLVFLIIVYLTKTLVQNGYTDLTCLRGKGNIDTCCQIGVMLHILDFTFYHKAN